MKLKYTYKDEVLFTKGSQIVPEIGTKIFFKEMNSKDIKRYVVSEIQEHVSYSRFSNSYTSDIEVVLVEDIGGLH